MKRWLVLFLALVMLLACGCSPQESNETTASTGPTGPTIQRPPEPKPETEETPNLGNVPPVITIQNMPETVDDAGGVPVLKWVCFVDTQTGGETRTWNEETVVEINQMLAQMEMPYRIQFQMVTVNRYLEPGQYDWFSQPEVQEVLEHADLIYGYMDRQDRITRLMPITDYVVGEDAPLKNAVPHAAYWQATSHEGEIYGIPTTLLQQKVTGWISQPRKYYVEYYGLTEEELQNSFWEMDTVFERIYEINEGYAFLAIPSDKIVNTGSGLSKGYLPEILSLQLEDLSLASCFVLDYSGGQPQVINYLEEDWVRQFRQAAVRYKKAGYAEVGDLNNLMYGNLTFHDLYAEYPVTDATVKIWPEQLTTGIAAGTKYADEAVSLLSLIAEDEAFRKHLFYGKEGRDYTLKDGVYQRLGREDRLDYSLDFLSPLSYFCGLTSETNDRFSWYRSTGTNNDHIPGTTGEEKLESHRSMLDSSQIIPPIAVDLTEYEEKVTNVNYVLRRYLPYFSFIGQNFGVYRQETTEEIYELMLLDLTDAGVEMVQEELQDQVNDWLQRNPILVK